MDIVTRECPNCGTIVADNVLQRRRVLDCPRLGCEHVFRFDQLTPEERSTVLENTERYELF